MTTTPLLFHAGLTDRDIDEAARAWLARSGVLVGTETLGSWLLGLMNGEHSDLGEVWGIGDAFLIAMGDERDDIDADPEEFAETFKLFTTPRVFSDGEESEDEIDWDAHPDSGEQTITVFGSYLEEDTGAPQHIKLQVFTADTSALTAGLKADDRDAAMEALHTETVRLLLHARDQLHCLPTATPAAQH